MSYIYDMTREVYEELGIEGKDITWYEASLEPGVLLGYIQDPDDKFRFFWWREDLDGNITRLPDRLTFHPEAFDLTIKHSQRD
jgi:8-oxo-dGTP pyrophosphatase MutT (NUDIX family)